jgi:hypothetical protein
MNGNVITGETMYTPVELDIEIEIEPATHRKLLNALTTSRTSFADLDILEQEDRAGQIRIAEIRQELEGLSGQPYLTELGNRYMSLTEEWLQMDPYGLLAFLDEVSVGSRQ